MRRIVLLGDSIVAACNGTRTNWFGLANLLAGRPYSEVVNLGVGGETTEQIRSRLDQALAVDADTVLVYGGGNDVNPHRRSTEDVTGDLAAMLADIEATGRIVIAATVLPSSFMADPEQVQTWREVNAWHRTHGHRLIEWEHVPGGPPDVNRRVVPDGVHPREWGAVRLALPVRRVLAR